MGSFICFGSLAVVVGLFIALGMYFEQQKKPVEIPLGEVPALVRNEALQRVKGLSIERVMKKPYGNSYRLYGQANGKPIRVKIRPASENSQPPIDKIEIQPETRSSHRSLKGKHLIDLSQVPSIVMQQAQQAVNTYGESLDEISRVKAATVQGRKAYDIKGWSGDWRLDVELLDDGELLEVEFEFQPNRKRNG